MTDTIRGLNERVHIEKRTVADNDPLGIAETWIVAETRWCSITREVQDYRHGYGNQNEPEVMLVKFRKNMDIDFSNTRFRRKDGTLLRPIKSPIKPGRTKGSQRTTFIRCEDVSGRTGS